MTDPRALALVLLAAGPALACGANKNHAQRERAAAAAEAEAEALDAGRPVGCIRSCARDPGSLPVDCAAAERGLEFLPKALWDFRDKPADANGVPIGYWGYQYDDESAPEPRNLFTPVDRCGNGDVSPVLHLFGGPFLGWGGGIGLSFKDWWGNGASVECDAQGLPEPCENSSLNPQVFKGHFVDASHWDGISLWARRGPESQAGLRVTVGDKYTDDEQNIDQNPNDEFETEQVYCKRARICSCRGGKPCTRWTEPDRWPDGSDNPTKGLEQSICYDPRYDPPIKGKEASSDPFSEGKYLLGGFDTDVTVEFCGTDACDRPFPAGGDDLAFEGKACTPHQFAAGENASYCFDPGDPPPAEGVQRCGDHWQAPIRLSTDWQLFLVPFNDMRQQGYGKESKRLLTEELSLFRLTWEGGYIDYYIDDLRFYRVKR